MTSGGMLARFRKLMELGEPSKLPTEKTGTDGKSQFGKANVARPESVCFKML